MAPIILSQTAPVRFLISTYYSYCNSCCLRAHLMYLLQRVGIEPWSGSMAGKRTANGMWHSVMPLVIFSLIISSLRLYFSDFSNLCQLFLLIPITSVSSWRRTDLNKYCVNVRSRFEPLWLDWSQTFQFHYAVTSREQASIHRWWKYGLQHHQRPCERGNEQTKHHCHVIYNSATYLYAQPHIHLLCLCTSHYFTILQSCFHLACYISAVTPLAQHKGRHVDAVELAEVMSHQ